jgi:hypothetical protein
MDEYNLMTSSMATSSAASDYNNYEHDDDVLNYLSTLSPNQQKMLDDFVSINDHTPLRVQCVYANEQSQQQQPHAVIQFAYGNSVGANHYFGRPVSMYEPQINHEFNSLPPDLVTSSNEPNSCLEFVDHPYMQKYSYEAEDADYIETLNEMRDTFDDGCNKLTFTADIHHCAASNNYVEYATVNKPKKHQSEQNLMITSSESASDPPRQKFPKIMTQSCYGELNNTNDMVWNNYEQDLEDGNHQQQNISSSQMTAVTTSTTNTAATDSSIIDGISSINSSIYEQIPSMTSSIETAMTAATTRQRKIVKWWDDHDQFNSIEHMNDESLQDLHETAEEGESIK